MLNLLHQSSTDELEMLDYLVEWARINMHRMSFLQQNRTNPIHR
jgi:hypothetical protein